MKNKKQGADGTFGFWCLLTVVGKNLQCKQERKRYGAENRRRNSGARSRLLCWPRAPPSGLPGREDRLHVMGEESELEEAR